MINKNIEGFLKRLKLEMSPHDLKRKKEESYVKRKYGQPVYYFHDTNAIIHYKFKNKDYRRKTLHVNIDVDKRTHEYPSYKRILNLKNIIRTHIGKNRILNEKTIDNGRKYEIKYEILFTSNNNIKSFQYFMDELAFKIVDNTIIQLRELSLDICSNTTYKKIIPSTHTSQIKNYNIIPLNNNLDKLSDFELATIGIEYEKEKILPPYDLAVEQEFSDEFFKENGDYYANERRVYAKNFLDSVMHATILNDNK